MIPGDLKKAAHQDVFIVGVTDNDYAQHLSVAFVSLLKNNKGGIPKLFVIGDKLNDINKNKLLKSVNTFGAMINFVEANDEYYKSLRVSRHITRAAYLKLLIPELVPLDVEKTIYLDGDVIVREDISDLWNIDVQGYHLGAVEDSILKNRLSLLIDKTGFPYFNSGVMLINLHKWREDKTSGRVFSFIYENNDKLLYHDQDALNAVLYNKWLKLDDKFNVQTPMLSRYVKKTGEGDNFFYGFGKPHIIHYTGRGKPWHYLNSHPFRDDYYKYLYFTSWKDFKPSLTMRNLIDEAGLLVKQMTPSLVAGIRRFLIKRALKGSNICRCICNFFHIELHIEEE